jgi:hypothetical protein
MFVARKNEVGYGLDTLLESSSSVCFHPLIRVVEHGHDESISLAWFWHNFGR